MFEHSFLTKPELTRVEVNGKRHYVSPLRPGHFYPSVTSVLDAAADKTGLDAWRIRVGEEQADRVSSLARNRGTALHKIMEKFLLNDPTAGKWARPQEKLSLRKIRPVLEKNVSKVLGIEFPLNSDTLDTAGTADLICLWKGKPAILDFKSSKHTKDESYIEHYFLQCTAYAMMANELFGLEIEDIVVIILVDHSAPQILERKTSQFQERVVDVFTRGTGATIEDNDPRKQAV